MGAGRPQKPATKPYSIRLTDDQYHHYQQLGGAAWIKRLIDASLAASEKVLEKRLFD
ncbi:hypothetical protein BLL52_4136 [Rhodoferax antarcticus ANT.BR]|uniref:Uncharacterized protein n=1 Tax=Rhodoferax antarcticus ANT.BR TaxID=1111071 RepID=A0A1Q8Y9H0_9BURK|nr:hypothetical protein BLL52_4136 [Rhodoferax antarcticus ANT.BR]